MSEPRATARRILPVVPGVVRWRVDDDRIDGSDSEAYAIVFTYGVVLIDPLPVDEQRLRHLGRIEAIILTAANHQRAAWRFRRTFFAPVLAPRGAKIGSEPGFLEEVPDGRYGHNSPLPGGVRPIHSPGPARAMYVLWMASTRVLFLSDLLYHPPRAAPRFIESSYQDDPAQTRESVRELWRRRKPEVLCFAHGPPILRGGRAALRRALEEDQGI